MSELGTTKNDGTDIVGLITGSSIYDNLGTKTIHLYTCNNECVNGRWIVLAKKYKKIAQVFLSYFTMILVDAVLTS